MIDSTAEQATEIRSGHRLDEAALFAWLGERIPGLGAAPRVRQFVGGQSNPTYLIETDVRRLVLRKKPPGELLQSAHQIDREYRAMQALGSTDVPVPRVLVLCEDPGVIGSTFFVMDFVDGRVFRDATLPQLTPGERSAIYDDAAQTLAKLHRIDFRAVGLGDFGRTGGYVTRQLSRWSRQYEASKTTEMPAMDELAAWLEAHVPADDETTIAHGDFRIENLIFATHAPKVAAILDWELSTLGHPLADLAYLTLNHYIPDHIARTYGGRGSVAHTPGIPTAHEIGEAYARYAGRAATPDMTFFVALSFYRLAAIAQGIRKRFELGNASAADAETRARMAPVIAQLGAELISTKGRTV